MQMRKPELIMAKDNNKMNNNINKSKLRKGLWSPEEDEKLVRYMITKGQGCWSDIARNAGLQRCGKSCRLRWINYLRPDLKRGAFSPQEEELIIHFHSILGNRYILFYFHFHFKFQNVNYFHILTLGHATSPHRSYKLRSTTVIVFVLANSMVHPKI